eukprot:6702837-Prymnesium_polylepis.1
MADAKVAVKDAEALHQAISTCREASPQVIVSAKGMEEELAEKKLHNAMSESAAGLRKAIAAARKIHIPPEKAIKAAGLRLTQLADEVLQKAVGRAKSNPDALHNAISEAEAAPEAERE